MSFDKIAINSLFSFLHSNLVYRKINNTQYKPIGSIEDYAPKDFVILKCI